MNINQYKRKLEPLVQKSLEYHRARRAHLYAILVFCAGEGTQFRGGGGRGGNGARAVAQYIEFVRNIQKAILFELLYYSALENIWRGPQARGGGRRRSRRRGRGGTAAAAAMTVILVLFGFAKYAAAAAETSQLQQMVGAREPAIVDFSVAVRAPRASESILAGLIDSFMVATGAGGVAAAELDAAVADFNRQIAAISEKTIKECHVQFQHAYGTGAFTASADDTPKWTLFGAAAEGDEETAIVNPAESELDTMLSRMKQIDLYKLCRITVPKIKILPAAGGGATFKIVNTAQQSEGFQFMVLDSLRRNLLRSGAADDEIGAQVIFKLERFSDLINKSVEFGFVGDAAAPANVGEVRARLGTFLAEYAERADLFLHDQTYYKTMLKIRDDAAEVERAEIERAAQIQQFNRMEELSRRVTTAEIKNIAEDAILLEEANKVNVKSWAATSQSYFVHAKGIADTFMSIPAAGAQSVLANLSFSILSGLSLPIGVFFLYIVVAAGLRRLAPPAAPARRAAAGSWLGAATAAFTGRAPAASPPAAAGSPLWDELARELIDLARIMKVYYGNKTRRNSAAAAAASASRSSASASGGRKLKKNVSYTKK